MFKTSIKALRRKVGLSNPSAKTHQNSNVESILSAISVGFFFILIGVLFIVYLPLNLWDTLTSFFSTFTIVQVQNTTISLLAPSNPAAFTVLYGVFFEFCMAIGIFSVVKAILRFWLKSPIDKKAEDIGSIVFWFGTAYLITIYLTSSVNSITWFIFWIWVLIVLGWSFIARAFVFLAKRLSSKT